MSIVHIERITCDNPECVAYVEELIREEPERFELVEYVREKVAPLGWSHDGDRDFCPEHCLAATPVGQRSSAGQADAEGPRF